MGVYITHKLIGFFAYIVWDVWGNEVNCKFSAVRLTSLYEMSIIWVEFYYRYN